ncbi:hypothetical protein CD932_00705 [Janthinobacterium sp. PC23-8]|nr:hypothetical protein CD932_00705 [Janthinobacterium sp. PC23-8]
MQSVYTKHQQLESIARAGKRRFGINRSVLITGLVLGAISVLYPFLVILPIHILLIGFLWTFLRKPESQRIALRQMKLLKQATAASFAERGISAERAAQIMKKYPRCGADIDYDAEMQQRFVALCKAAGMQEGGILPDDRLL